MNILKFLSVSLKLLKNSNAQKHPKGDFVRQARQAFDPNALPGCFVWEYMEVLRQPAFAMLCMYRFFDGAVNTLSLGRKSNWSLSKRGWSMVHCTTTPL